MPACVCSFPDELSPETTDGGAGRKARGGLSAVHAVEPRFQPGGGFPESQSQRWKRRLRLQRSKAGDR